MRDALWGLGSGVLGLGSWVWGLGSAWGLGVGVWRLGQDPKRSTLDPNSGRSPPHWPVTRSRMKTRGSSPSGGLTRQVINALPSPSGSIDTVSRSGAPSCHVARSVEKRTSILARSAPRLTG